MSGWPQPQASDSRFGKSLSSTQHCHRGPHGPLTSHPPRVASVPVCLGDMRTDPTVSLEGLFLRTLRECAERAVVLWGAGQLPPPVPSPLSPLSHPPLPSFRLFPEPAVLLTLFLEGSPRGLAAGPGRATGQELRRPAFYLQARAAAAWALTPSPGPGARLHLRPLRSCQWLGAEPPCEVWTIPRTPLGPG